MGGNPGNPPDKPGLAEVIELYKTNFGDTWQQLFRDTVHVSLAYQYSEKE
jgi:hypothetical protein